jgi:peptidoglycan/xylan/chitin deacetylase (PgdA/CDA1 family)
MRARPLVRTAFHRSGALRLVRYLNRKGARILTYHRFQDSSALLESQCAHIVKWYHPVSLTELGRCLRSGDPFPSGALAVTVDDGYREFFDVAYPVFSAYRIPATVFLTTDFLDRKSWLWVDRWLYAFEHACVRILWIDLPSGRMNRFPLGSVEERTRAAWTLLEDAKRIPDEQRLKLMEDLPGLLETTLPDEPPPEYTPLSWDQVREMMGHGIEFGAHTKTHPILSRMADKREQREEIEGSKLRVEQETGNPVLHFAYPNGLADDYDSDVVELVERARFQTAVTMQGGLNFPGENPYLLNRIGVGLRLPELEFREYAAGFRVARPG